MRNNGAPLPGVREISRIIDAVRDYAVTTARASCEGHLADIYHAPALASWDAFRWFKLVQKWGLVDFLVSGSAMAERLVKTLQCCIQWYGQREIDEIHSRLKVMGMIN